MISSFYTASTGAIELQKGFDTIANNIANVNTNGFKSTNASFQDLVYTNIQARNSENLISGNGAKLSRTDVVYKAGSLQSTGRSLDHALTEDGFFAVQIGEQIKFTRCGNFNLTPVNGKMLLTSSTGGFVLDKNYKPIEVKSKEDKLPIGVFTFQNTDGLKQEENLLFSPTELSKDAIVIENADIKKGYLEGSNVDTAEQMGKIIESQRAFQFNSRVIQVSDEIMQTVNNLR